MSYIIVLYTFLCSVFPKQICRVQHSYLQIITLWFSKILLNRFKTLLCYSIKPIINIKLIIDFLILITDFLQKLGLSDSCTKNLNLYLQLICFRKKCYGQVGQELCDVSFVGMEPRGKIDRSFET